MKSTNRLWVGDETRLILCNCANLVSTWAGGRGRCAAEVSPWTCLHLKFAALQTCSQSSRPSHHSGQFTLWALEDAMQSPAPGQEQADTLHISCPLPSLLGRDAATSPSTTEAENDAPIHTSPLVAGNGRAAQ